MYRGRNHADDHERQKENEDHEAHQDPRHGDEKLLHVALRPASCRDLSINDKDPPDAYKPAPADSGRWLPKLTGESQTARATVKARSIRLTGITEAFVNRQKGLAKIHVHSKIHSLAWRIPTLH